MYYVRIINIILKYQLKERTNAKEKLCTCKCSIELRMQNSLCENFQSRDNGRQWQQFYQFIFNLIFRLHFTFLLTNSVSKKTWQFQIWNCHVIKIGHFWYNLEIKFRKCSHHHILNYTTRNWAKFHTKKAVYSPFSL